MAGGTIYLSNEGPDKLQGRIRWGSTASDSAANYSTVWAVLEAYRPRNGPSWGTEWSGFVKIGTEQQNVLKGYREIDDEYWTEMARKEKVIVSHNDDGTGSVEISGKVQGPTGTSLASLETVGSQTVQLDTIARYFTQKPTITLTSKTETSFTLTWNTSETCSQIEWYVNGVLYDTTNENSKTGPYTISGRSANSTYQIVGRFYRKDSNLYTDSDASRWTTYQYPYVTGVTTADLKIGNQQTISLYNPLNRSVNIYMKKDNTSGTTLYSQDSATNRTSYSFTPTANTLYASIPNSQSGNAVYYCTYSGQTVQTKSGTYSTRGIEVPTFTNYTAVDSNSTTTTLTGNSSTIVKGYSNILVTISKSNKATATAEASMSSYKIQVGTMTPITKDYSSSQSVTATQNNATSGSVSVSAIDSRGYAETVTKTLTMKEYFKPYITEYTAVRDDNGVATTTKLNFKVNFWNESFGTGHNALTSLTYKYRASYEANWTTGTTDLLSQVTTSGNQAIGSISVKGDLASSGFTLGTTFEIQLTATDKLDTTTSSAVLLSGTPAIAIAGNKVAIGGPVSGTAITDFQVHRSMQVDGTIYGNVNGNLDGKAKQLDNYYTSRPTSANLTADGSGTVKKFLATSSMTTGKPPADAHILHLSWDNTTGFDSQIAIGNAQPPQVWVRGGTTGNWGNWEELVRATEFGYLGTYTSVSGTYKTGAWTTGTATNCTWTAPRNGKYIIFMYFQAATDSTAYIYKQLQAKGTATRPLGDVLLFQGGPSSGGSSTASVIAETFSFPVSATQGQTIYPYVHTPQANLIWNVQITGMYVGK